MKLEQARVDFSLLQKKISAYKHATALIYHDGETAAPPDTLDNRTRALQVLNDELVRLSIGPETMELLHYLEENQYDLTVNERRAVEYMLKDYNRRKSIPVDEYVRYEQLLIEAQDAWHKARENNDFEDIRPFLEDIFNTSRHFALLDRPNEDPYLYWLANYEEGLSVETCDQIFEMIKNGIPELVKEITEKSKVEIKKVDGEFPVSAQEELALYILELFGVNMNRVGLAFAEHSFTTQLGSHFDERIGIKYTKRDFTSSMYSVMHSAGHILCDMGQADNLAYTALDGTASMVILESQGYFYENIVGKSREFIEHIYPELQDLFPNYMKDVTADDFYKAVNRVEPGLIRVDFDELTFMLHTMIRYELEKAMLRQDLPVKELPDAWRDMYKKYLGLDVTNHVEGILQDIHWPFGAIGYFPTYVIGNSFGFSIANKMRETIDIEACVSEGDFSKINEWSHERIWKHGGIYTSSEIMKKFVGASPDNTAHIEYLKNKYKEIYKL